MGGIVFGGMDVSVWTDLCSVGMLDVNIKEVVR